MDEHDLGGGALLVIVGRDHHLADAEREGGERQRAQPRQQAADDLTADLEPLHPGEEPTKLGKAVREFDSYLRANTARIPNYGERRRAGEAISTALTESAANQVISKRMAKNSRCAGHPAASTSYSRSAPASSTASSPGDLRRWYPGLNPAPDPAALGA